MIITTRNSVYRLYQDGDEVVLTKISGEEGSDFKVGSQRRARESPPVAVGGTAWIGGWQTSTIKEIKQEADDKKIRFLA